MSTDAPSSAGTTLRRRVAAYWSALLAMLPCNRSGACGLIIEQPDGGPRRRS